MPHKTNVQIYKIDGVGVNLERFYPCTSSDEKIALREKYGFASEDFILIYTAEFIPRKNHKLLFDILPALKAKIPPLKVLLCGKGELLEQYKDFAAEKQMERLRRILRGMEKSGAARESDAYQQTAEALRALEQHWNDGEEKER